MYYDPNPSESLQGTDGSGLLTELNQHSPQGGCWSLYQRDLTFTAFLVPLQVLFITSDSSTPIHPSDCELQWRSSHTAVPQPPMRTQQDLFVACRFQVILFSLAMVVESKITLRSWKQTGNCILPPLNSIFRGIRRDNFDVDT